MVPGAFIGSIHYCAPATGRQMFRAKRDLFPRDAQRACSELIPRPNSPEKASDRFGPQGPGNYQKRGLKDSVQRPVKCPLGKIQR
eukprot:s2381_g4.t1